MSAAKEGPMVGPATPADVKRDDRAPESPRVGRVPAESPSEAPDDLMREFMAGAGMLDANIPIKLTPEMMNLIGQLLRECIQGTLDLLLARAVAKQQMRAGVTILIAKDNNPLKFSPTVEMALGHLLGQQHRGFMSPREAIKDAYEDLRKHQVGTMVGVQAALTSILGRFRPDRIEKRLTESSVMDSLLPGNRKAKLWDLFAELHKDISREAEDDFEALFGKEFVRAYEAQIAEIERPDTASNG
jgi:FHA domain-containing protein